VSGKEIDVRIVPHQGLWAVKLTGRVRKKKPVHLTPHLEEARAIAKSLAWKYQVPILEYDANGTFVSETDWTALGPFKGKRER
jgi:hypothetical protein